MSRRREQAQAAASSSQAPDAIGAVTARADYMMGNLVERTWEPDDAVAWEGLLETARTLRRGAETLLEQQHGLSISMLGIMGRLARAPRHTLRQTDLAEAMGLSLSRISRIIDILETRELVRRQRCPSDARATHVVLTHTGRTRTAAAQQTIHAYADTRFVQQLSKSERTTLAAVFSRLIDQAAGTGDGDAADSTRRPPNVARPASSPRG